MASTPLRVWLSTGVRAVDRCVEAICYANASVARTESAVRWLRRLVGGLLGARRAGEDRGEEQRQQRLSCQLGALEAIKAPLGGVSMGASHGIGHQLGPLGVGHGETSCVLLPAVCRFNKSVNAAAQALVVEAILGVGGSNAGGDDEDGPAPAAKTSSPGATDLDPIPDSDSHPATKSNSTPNPNSNSSPNLQLHDPNWTTLDFGHWKHSGCDLGALLDAYFRELGMPRSLREVGGGGIEGVEGKGIGRDKWEGLARGSLRDRWCKTNPVALKEVGDVLRILEMCE